MNFSMAAELKPKWRAIRSARSSPVMTWLCPKAPIPLAAAASPVPCSYIRSQALRQKRGTLFGRGTMLGAKVIDITRSMGMAMSPCILPGVGKPGFVLADDEIEVGMGIHGEPGVERERVKTSKELAEILCGHSCGHGISAARTARSW